MEVAVSCCCKLSYMVGGSSVVLNMFSLKEYGKLNAAWSGHSGGGRFPREK